MAFASGEASIYVTGGSGLVGGSFSHDTIRQAAIKIVTVPREYRSPAKPTVAYPLRDRGGVKSYFLTDAGVFIASATVGALTEPRPSSKIRAMNTFDDSTGVFHSEDPKMDFSIAMIDNRPGFEMFQITACSQGNGTPFSQTPCNGDELLQWLGRFFGDNDEDRFIHIIERIRMDRRQDEGESKPGVGP